MNEPTNELDPAPSGKPATGSSDFGQANSNNNPDESLDLTQPPDSKTGGSKITGSAGQHQSRSREPNFPHPVAGQDSFALGEVDETAAFDSQTKREKTAPFEGGTQPRVVGDYVLSELLGEGGMGRVFRAADSTGAAVAIKLLSPSLSRSADAMARFKQEGLIASQINHCHIVFVHRVDESGGIPYIAMELMTGRTLKDLVYERGPLPYPEALRLILQCIAGLCEAHARGMIHRDIKPANCYLDEDGNVKVGDFGLARSLVSDSELTQAGTFLGTPLYAAPEQLLGQPVDARSDIYSLTATLYFLLAGKAPFESPNAAQVIARIASSDPPSFKSIGIELPLELEEIVMKGLSRDPNKRYSSFEELREDLMTFMAPKPEPASLFRRIIAGLADSMLVSTLVGIGIFLVFPVEQLAHAPYVIGLISATLMMLYFWSVEALFGTSIGKAALRIQVVDSRTGRKPGVTRCFVRAFSFVAVMQGLALFGQFLLRFFAIESSVVIGIVEILGNCIGYALSYWIWRKTGKRQLLHDWLSNTQCQLYASLPARITDLELPNWKPQDRPNSDPLPTLLGRFRIQREMECPVVSPALGQAYRWYEAIDPQLDRSVWIALSKDRAIELDQLQRRKIKFSRVRFIEEGSDAGGRWFAFVAPEGLPLRECLAAGIHLPWSQTRSVLQQISRISEQREYFNELPTSDRVWIDRRGRICLVDFLEPRNSDRPPQSQEILTKIAGGSQNKLIRLDDHGTIECLIHDVCALALSPSDRTRRKLLKPHVRPKPLPVESLLPRKAWKLCQSVVAGKCSFNLDQFLSEIQRLANGPSMVSSTNRFFNATLSLAFLTPLIVVAWFCLAFPGLFFCIELSSSAKSLHSLERLADLSSLGKFDKADWEGATDEEFVYFTSRQGREKIKESLTAITERLKASHGKLGWIEQTVWSQIPGLDDALNLKNSYPFLSDHSFQQGDALAVDNGQDSDSRPNKASTDSTSTTNIRIGGKQIAWPNSDQNWNSKKLRKAMTQIEQEQSRKSDPPHSAAIFCEESAELSYILFNILGGLIAGCAIWTWLTLGGAAQYLTGICFVCRDGRRISLVRSGLRAMVLYLPVLFLVYWILLWPLADASDIFWTTQLKRLALLVPFAYLATTLLRSNRTPLDFITGTAAIPR